MSPRFMRPDPNPIVLIGCPVCFGLGTAPATGLKVYVCWDTYDYYGPDPLPDPYIFFTEAEARRRIAAYVDEQKRPSHLKRWTKDGYGMCVFEEVEVTIPGSSPETEKDAK